MQEQINILRNKIALMRPAEQDIICSVEHPLPPMRVKIRYNDTKEAIHPMVYVTAYGVPKEARDMIVKIFHVEYLRAIYSALKDVLEHLTREQQRAKDLILKCKTEPKDRSKDFSKGPGLHIDLHRGSFLGMFRTPFDYEPKI